MAVLGPFPAEKARASTGLAQVSPWATAPARAGRGATLFVWGCWAAMLVGVLVFIRAYGYNVPFYDEWAMVDALVGNQPIDLAWLWSQHNEHRIVLPRLIYLGLAQCTHADFRAGMYFNGLVLGALAAAMILAAQRLRGRISYADAFFPLALLNLGHCENLLWSFQIEFVVSTLFAGGLLLLILRSREPLTGKGALAGGLCLVALPLCGAHGLPFVPPLAGWFAVWGLRHRHAPDGAGTRHRAVALVGVAAALFLAAFYFVGFHPVATHGPSRGLGVALKVAWQFLTMSFGGGITSWWNSARFVLGGLLIASVVALAVRWWQCPSERLRCLGLGLFLLSLVGLALGIGWGRSGTLTASGFAFRYATLAVPVLCCIYFVAEVCGPPSFACFLQMGLFTLFLALGWANTRTGIIYANSRRPLFEALERDLQAHLPPDVIGPKHSFLFPLPDPLVERLEMLRRAGIGKFKDMAVPRTLTTKDTPSTTKQTHAKVPAPRPQPPDAATHR